jgi:cell division protein FtsQ
VRRRIRRGRVAAVVAIVAAIGLVVGGLALSRSSLLGARNLVVEGAVTRGDATLLREAGLDAGTNVLYVDREAVVARLLEADPWVESAWLERDLPSTLILHVHERTPVAVADGAVVSSDGIALPGARADGLPTIRASVGSVPTEAVGDAAATLRALPGNLRRTVRTVLVLPDGGLELATDDGPTIVWGRRGMVGEKLVALRAVVRWGEQAGEGLAVIDVSVPANPAARLADGSTVIP